MLRISHDIINELEKIANQHLLDRDDVIKVAVIKALERWRNNPDELEADLLPEKDWLK